MGDMTKSVEREATDAAAAPDDKGVEGLEATNVANRELAVVAPVPTVTAIVFAQTRPTQAGAIEKAALLGGADSLAYWVALYLRGKVQGGSPNTLDAKTRDLARFVRWFVTTNGLCDMRAWRPRDTRTYLRALAQSFAVAA